MTDPGWLGDELAEEWPDDDENSEGESFHASQQDPEQVTSPEHHTNSSVHVGTFVVHPDDPLLPKTPARGQRNFRDVFTPLKLETMFIPPPELGSSSGSVKEVKSSPSQSQRGEGKAEQPLGSSQPTASTSSNLSDTAPVNESPAVPPPKQAFSFDGQTPFQFTFSVQRTPPSTTPAAETAPSSTSQHNSTAPLHQQLKLFQLNYDTFTRDHLSALVDAIPTASTSMSEGVKPLSTSQRSESDDLLYRATKRIKLGSPDDSWVGTPPVRLRPRFSLHSVKNTPIKSTPIKLGRDLIRKSKSLMEEIRESKSVPRNTRLCPPSETPTEESSENEGVVSQNGPKRGVYSSLGFKRQAADLMAQIRRDAQQRRVVSTIPEADSQYSTMTTEELDLPQLPAFQIPVIQQIDPTMVSAPASQVPSFLNTPQSFRPTPSPVTLELPRLFSASTLADSASGASSAASAASAASGVKHPGSPTKDTRSGEGQPIKRVTTIGPTDLPTLPEHVNGMVFDRLRGIWRRETDDTSDDPFKDFESLIDGDGDTGPLPDMSLRVEPRHSFPDEDDTTFSVSSLDEKEKSVVPFMTGVEESVEDSTPPASPTPHSLPSPFIAAALPPPRPIPSTPARLTKSLSEPSSLPTTASSRSMQTPIKSVLKSTASHQATPYHPSSSRRDVDTTPKPRRSRRSVSFSDGKKSGKIRELHPAEEIETTQESIKSAASMQDQSTSSTQQSARGKRITNLLDDLVDDTEMRVGSKRKNRDEKPDASKRTVQTETTWQGNATFLTDCSFGIAHDRLVQCITDAQPFEPHWDQLLSIDLSNKAIDSVARLREFLPMLDSLKIDHNLLSWLSGLPKSLRSLSATHNQLTGLTAYTHLSTLEYLDISHNQMDSLLQLECLKHLKELRADHNCIRELDGVLGMQYLKKLSVSNNNIEELDFSKAKWSSLEQLDISVNALKKVVSLDAAQKLSMLNLEQNELSAVVAARAMPHLRSLRLNDNYISGEFDVKNMGGLRLLYADRNRLTGVINGDRLTKLESLSLRQQSGPGLKLCPKDMRDVRRLYLSGNNLSGGWVLTEPCFNLVYLELARCQLSSLPDSFSTLFPNIRSLSLNFNFLDDLAPLDGLSRLRKLSIIGSRVKSTKRLISIAKSMPELERIDFRMNPCTLSWYMPILDVNSTLKQGHLSPEEDVGDSVQAVDAKFRRGLPDDLYMGRLLYRGLLMKSCISLVYVDGVKVTEGERDKAAKLLIKFKESRRGVKTDVKDLRSSGNEGKNPFLAAKLDPSPIINVVAATPIPVSGK